ncbi:MAG: AI-2E family transporter [Chloroflexi bacterium]|nr:AI-2E family transporter [Chloroflexota bacterium]
MLERSFWLRAALVVVVFSAAIYLFGALGRLWAFLGDLLLIFFLAYLVGSLLIQVVNSLMRIPHMPRPIAILLVYMALLTIVADLIILVIPATVEQVIELAEQVPEFVAGAPAFVAQVDEFVRGFNIVLPVDLETLLQEQLDSLTNFAGTATEAIIANAGGILQNVLFTFWAIGLVVVISFYIVLDGGRRLNEALKVLPPRAEHETRFVLRTIDGTFRGYLGGILVISLIYGVGTATVMTVTGLPAALPVAIISSVLLAVPFFGDQLALVLPLIVAAVSGSFVTFLTVLATLLFIQQVMLNLLTPRILGRAVRMPAMLVVIAVVLGFRLAGVPGALLAVPTAGVMYTLSVHYGMGIRRRREARNEEEEAPERRPIPTRAAAPRRRPAPSTEPTGEPAAAPETEPMPIAGAASPTDSEP